jgi:hypothetical protein
MKYAGALWAARRRFRRDPHCKQLISRVLDDLYAEFGWKARLAAPIVGRYLYHTLCREERRLQSGRTYEPPTFFEVNSADGPDEATRVGGITATSAANDEELELFRDTQRTEGPRHDGKRRARRQKTLARAFR